MAMMVGRTWPGRPRPLPDELFSSWFGRVAAANGLTAAELYRLIVPKGAGFSSDLDRGAGQDLITAMSAGTGIEPSLLWSTTLVDWGERVFELEEGIWMPSVRADHSRPTYSQQYCSLCLGEDQPAVFRRSWRLKFTVACDRHGIFLADRCPHCGKSIRPAKVVRIRNRLLCPDCEDSLTLHPIEAASGFDYQARLIKVVELGHIDHPGLGQLSAYEWFNLLGSAYRMMAGGLWASKLRKVVAMAEPNLAAVLNVPQCLNIHTLPASDRHPLIQGALWLLDEWPSRFFGAAQFAGVSTIKLGNIWPHRIDLPTYEVINQKAP